MEAADVTQEIELTTHQRDLTALIGEIGPWLAARLGADADVRLSELEVPQGAGMSSVTVLTTASFEVAGEPRERELVLRLAPEESSCPIFTHYDFARQYDVMAAVGAHSDVPVPALVGIDAAGDLVGTPFLVMERLHGRTPVDNPPYVFDGWLLDAAPEERRRLQEGHVDLIARVHAIDPAVLPALVEEAGEDPLRTHVEAQRREYADGLAAHGLRVPVLERAFERLEETWPDDPGEPVLCWGDCRPANVLYDGFDPAAALDWEMACVAPRGVDVAWFPVLHRFFQDIAELFELPGLRDFARPADVVATYRELTGVEVRDLEWFLLYAALRHGIIMARVKRRMIRFEGEAIPEDPDDYVMHRAMIERLLTDGWR